MEEKIAGEIFDRSTVKREILIHLSDFPEKIIKAKNSDLAALAIKLGNCLRGIAPEIEGSQTDSTPPIGETALTVVGLACQLRQAGLATWDCGKISDPVAVKLEKVSHILEAVLGRLSAIEKRGAK